MARERGDAARQIDGWSYLWLVIAGLAGIIGSLVVRRGAGHCHTLPSPSGSAG
jgi:hypothetical protein